METVFDRAFAIVVGNEGGYSNDPVDLGGETKYGIAKRFYPDLDIKHLTLENAKDIYRKNYWNRCKCELIKNEKLATQIFDIAINCGIYGAGVIVQRAINVTSKIKISEDGIIGNRTIASINASDVKILNNNIVRKRIEYYQRIVNKRPEQIKFMKGWTKRAEEFLI